MDDTLINGAPGASLSSADRGLHYGDGLFETIACRDGRPRWLTLHLQRLRAGCERLRLPFLEFEALQSEVIALAAGCERCIVKAIVTRGVATRRGYAPHGDERPTRLVSRHPWPADAPAGPFRVGVSEVKLGVNPRLAGLKHLNRLEQVLARMECERAQLQEVLMLSSSDCLVGGAMSNVFIAVHGALLTPALDECGVGGVMRRVVLETCAAQGIGVGVRRIGSGELSQASEAFVTNVRWGVQPIDELDGRALAPPLFAPRLRQQIDAAHA